MLGASDADGAVLATAGVAERLAGLLRAAFAQGTTGLVSDMAGYTLRPWGFEPANVVAETLLVYGSADPITGPAHGQWWQGQLRNAQLEIAPGAGHLVIVSMWERVLSHIAPTR
jgi:pimeloyl-ACP methyl ester carboxylesterase